MTSEPLRILVIADPIMRLNTPADTSLALAEAALAKGHHVSWCDADDVHIYGAEVVVTASARVRQVTLEAVTVDPDQGRVPLSAFTHAFVRKDPPFDDSYKDLCWMLAAQSAVKVINSAECLLSFHEKALQWRAAADGFLPAASLVPSCVSFDVELIAAFCEERVRQEGPQRFITKPWLGYGGSSVALHESAQDAVSFVRAQLKAAPARARERFIVQPYLPEILTAGDRRVLIAEGVVICDFVRFPAAGKIAANLAQGGSAQLIPMTARQKALMDDVASFLVRQGISLAGVDLIDERVGEINITSPTGVRTFERLSGTRVAGRVLDLLLAQDAAT